MKHSHYAFAITAVALIACSETTTPTRPGALTGGSDHQTVILDGTVILNPAGGTDPRLVLRVTGGPMVGLYGGVSPLLESVIGGQVHLEGEQLNESVVEVQSFVVLMVGGRPVRDGVLIRTSAGEYLLRLTIGGYDSLIDPPAELRAHIGDRLWISGPDDGPPNAFGVIQ
jgi:hypothetical protein